MAVGTDRQALDVAIACCLMVTPIGARIARIRDTKHLEWFYASASLLPDLLADGRGRLLLGLDGLGGFGGRLAVRRRHDGEHLAALEVRTAHRLPGHFGLEGEARFAVRANDDDRHDDPRMWRTDAAVGRECIVSREPRGGNRVCGRWNVSRWRSSEFP